MDKKPKNITSEDLNAVLKQLLTLFKAYTKSHNLEFDKYGQAINELEDEMEKVDEDILAQFEAIKKDISERVAKIKDGKPGRDGTDGKDGYTPIKNKDYFDGLPGKDGKDGRNGVDGKNGVDGMDGKNGKDGKDGSPDTADDIRNKLELLIGEERLDKKAIKGLEEYDKDINALKARPSGGHSGAPSHPMKFQALTADGVTKIFTVPKSITSIVLTSDFPYVLWENGTRNNGFTINASRTQITLTTENAPSADAQLLYQFVAPFNY